MLVLVGTVATAETLTNKEVIALHQAGLSSEVIVQKISTSTCRFTTDTDALIVLKKAGVPDAVVTAMLRATTPRPSAEAPAAPTSKPVEPVKPATFLVYQHLCTVQLSVQAVGITMTPVDGCRGNSETYTWESLSGVCITAWDEHPGKPRGGRTPSLGSRKGSLYLRFKDGGTSQYTTRSSIAVRHVRDHIAKYKPALTEACDETYD